MKVDDLISMKTYYIALGQFVEAFAFTEYDVKRTFAHVCGISDDTSRAIFSGTRALEAIGLIRRVFESRGEKIGLEFNDALSHLATINGTRNDLIHHSAFWAGDHMLMTNALHQIRSRVKTAKLVIADLEDMTADLGKIRSRLVLFMLGPNSVEPENLILDHTVAASMSWRYKPPQPIHDL